MEKRRKFETLYIVFVVGIMAAQDDETLKALLKNISSWREVEAIETALISSDLSKGVKRYSVRVRAKVAENIRDRIKSLPGIEEAYIPPRRPKS